MHTKKVPAILLMLALTKMLFNDPVLICFKQIHLYVQSTSAMCFFTVSVFLWYSCFSGFRRSCCNNSWLEVLYYLLPAEVFLAILFAQYHFIMCILIVLVWIALEIAFSDLVDRKPDLWDAKGLLMRRFTVVSAAMLCAIPAFFALFIYGLETPTYIADVNNSEAESELDDDETEDLYESNLALLCLFEESSWDGLSLDDKLSTIRDLVDFESNILGIPAVEVVGTELMDSSLLGYYDNSVNEIYVNIELLENYEPGKVVETICHETFHSYQYYLVENTNWDNETLNQTAYYSELYSWKCNEENYKSVYLYGYEEYASQPLESSAREYASEERERIESYIEAE